MFQLIVSCTYNFIINDQNIGPLSLISSSPYLLLSLSHSLTPPLSSFLLLPLSLPPSLPLSLSLYLHLSSDLISLSPPLPLFLSLSTSLPLFLSLSTSLPLFLSLSTSLPLSPLPPRNQNKHRQSPQSLPLPRELSLSVTRVTRVTGY